MRKFILLWILFINVAFAQKIVVIVNEANPLSKITMQQLQDFYFKRARQWPNGTALRFFDRAEDSVERRIFLTEFLSKTSRLVDQFWIGQKLYSGASAPSHVSSDRMVASLVARFPGGISYVSESFTPLKGVKVITVSGE